jgi:hypothetical protein
MDNSIWNILLKLKKLPFGSVHCIKDEKMEKIVEDIIDTSIKNKCIDDVDIHDKFVNRYKDWISSTQRNEFSGLDQFTVATFSNGTTESFDKFYLENNHRRLRCFRGEYMYHLVAANHYFKEFSYIDEGPILDNDVVIFSLPFAGTGDEHRDTENLLSSCDQLSVPVMIDCCYFGVCSDIKFNFDHPSIQTIAFSLSKNFPVQHLRIGMRLTREDRDDALSVYHKNKYINRLSAAVGLSLIEQFTPDYNVDRYKDTQRKFCSELSINPSKCVFFATTEDSFHEYNRGTESNRLCFSKYLNQGFLP